MNPPSEEAHDSQDHVALLTVGMTGKLSRTYRESDVTVFASITGDTNPAHLDEAFANESVFHGRIVHGFLTASLISAVLGTIFPGPGTIYLSQDLRFRRPVRFGDTITATVEVVEVLAYGSRVRLNTTCTNQRDEVVIDGSALVIPPNTR